MDIFATACDIAGVSIPDGIDGASFLPALTEVNPPDIQRDLYFVCREGGPAYGGKTIDAFRRGDWKLLQNNPFAGMELYNLNADPTEATNRIETEPDEFHKLLIGLQKEIQRGGAVPWQPPAH